MVLPPGRAGFHTGAANWLDGRTLPIRPVLLLIVLLMLTGCSRMVSNATSDLADNLVQAIANNDDLDTVKAGGPAYLLMMDGLVRRDPENGKLLMRAAALYSAYGEAFVDDPARSRRLSRRAFSYATRALCAHDQGDCHLRQADFEVFEARMQRIAKREVPLFFTWGAAWAGWIQARSDDLDAVAEIARVEAIMQRIAVVDEGYQRGSVHLYLGTFAILVPPALGGRPEVARQHFEQAIALSAGQNLMAKVVYARRYARMVFDRPLHDRLLTEVLAADPHVPEMVLWNSLAQEQARELLATADDFF